MSDGMEIDARMMVTKDEEMDPKGSELRECGLTNQMTVMMTDKGPVWSTPCKGENKEVSLSELGSTPTGSVESLQNSQSSEGGSGMSMNPPVGGTRVLKFDDTLSKEDYQNFKLIYKSLLLEGRAGNLTNLTLEMVLAEKPPTWLSVIYERLKHLIINADALREKVRMGHYPQIVEKRKKSNQNRGKQPRGVKVVKNRRHNSGKCSKNTRTQGNNLKSGSTIGNQKEFDLVCWI